MFNVSDENTTNLTFRCMQESLHLFMQSFTDSVFLILRVFFPSSWQKKDSDQAWFIHLLCAVTAHNAVSIFAGIFTLQKLEICMLFNEVWFLNVFFIHTTHMPCVSKIFKILQSF